MMTFTEAREKVERLRGAQWIREEQRGVFYVLPTGAEDADAYMLTYGAEEWLVDDDLNYARVDSGGVLVLKKSGDLVNVQYLDDPDRFDAMTSVSVG